MKEELEEYTCDKLNCFDEGIENRSSLDRG